MSVIPSPQNDGLTKNWLVSPGQCLVCGGRGGYPGNSLRTVLCPRCEGSGRDPQRGTEWFMDLILPIQIRESSR